MPSRTHCLSSSPSPHSHRQPDPCTRPLYSKLRGLADPRSQPGRYSLNTTLLSLALLSSLWIAHLTPLHFLIEQLALDTSALCSVDGLASPLVQSRRRAAATPFRKSGCGKQWLSKSAENVMPRPFSPQQLACKELVQSARPLGFAAVLGSHPTVAIVLALSFSPLG